MADYRRLIKILEKETASQEKLLQLLISERTAITLLRNDELKKISGEKDKLLSKAKQFSEERNSFISGLGLDVEQQLKLDDIAKSCDDPKTRNDLLSVGKGLKVTANQVRTMNDHNAELIKSSIGLVLSTISIFRGAPDSDLPTYESSGRLKNESETSLRRSIPLAREG